MSKSSITTIRIWVKMLRVDTRLILKSICRRSMSLKLKERYLNHIRVAAKWRFYLFLVYIIRRGNTKKSTAVTASPRNPSSRFTRGTKPMRGWYL